MNFRALIALPLAAAMALAGCGTAEDELVFDIAFIGQPEELQEQGLRLSPAGQHLRAATREGLVALSEDGEIVPAIAERWIVADDGSSYIFRLRNSNWADGEPITGEQVRDQLRRTIERLRDTSLGLDLAQIAQVRAMTGRVVEIRLRSPMPDFLHLLAQPEMGLERGGEGAGPMALSSDGEELILTAQPPSRRGLPESENWQEGFRELRVRALPPAEAVEAFETGRADLVLNGTIADLPLANVGALSRGTVRLDAVTGLFGLEIRNEYGFLASVANREAVAMAIDRSTLMQPFNVGGWTQTTRIVAPGLPDDGGAVGERWQDLSIGQRQQIAAGRVAAWESATGSDLVLEIYLPQGPGSDLLFTRIARGLAEAGISARRAERFGTADLALKDRPARYAGTRWFLNQFNCRLVSGPCSEEADALVQQSLATLDAQRRAVLLAEAERALIDANVFIPFGVPIRWSLVRGGVSGFEENRWSVHPLFPLAQRPI